MPKIPSKVARQSPLTPDTCKACRGTRQSSSGARCVPCKGTGRVQTEMQDMLAAIVERRAGAFKKLAE